MGGIWLALCASLASAATADLIRPMGDLELSQDHGGERDFYEPRFYWDDEQLDDSDADWTDEDSIE